VLRVWRIAGHRLEVGVAVADLAQRILTIIQREGSMDKITRREFVGSWVIFWLLCVTIIGIPVAILYFINGTVTIEQQIDNAERFMEEFRGGGLSRKKTA
jgi:hypothetical protein